MFYKLTNLTVFAVLLKDVPIGSKDAVLAKLLLRNYRVNCLTYDESTGQPNRDNLCLFRALALHLRRNQRLQEKTSKSFVFFHEWIGGTQPESFPRRSYERHYNC